MSILNGEPIQVKEAETQKGAVLTIEEGAFKGWKVKIKADYPVEAPFVGYLSQNTAVIDLSNEMQPKNGGYFAMQVFPFRMWGHIPFNYLEIYDNEGILALRFNYIEGIPDIYPHSEVVSELPNSQIFKGLNDPRQIGIRFDQVHSPSSQPNPLPIS